MAHVAALLAGHPFCTTMNASQIVDLADCSRSVRLAPGDFILREHGPADRFYLIIEGQVALRAAAPHIGPLPIQTLLGGDVLGWSWLVPPYRWHFDAQALRPTHVIAIDAAKLRALCDADHELGYQVMRRLTALMAQRLQATRLQLLELYGLPN